MKQYKKLNKAGGITIPQRIRSEMGIHPGTPLTLSVSEHNGQTVTLQVEKKQPTCRLCGSVDRIISVDGLELCQSCIDALYAKRQEVCQND